MSLTPKQLEMRRGGIGASEVAAILELSPWSTPLDVYVAKTQPHLDEAESPEMGVGTALEDGLRALAAQRTGIPWRRSTTLRHRTHPRVLATPDGLSPKDVDAGIEIKVVGANMAHHWASGVPDYVAVQAAMGMAVTGRSRWYVAALIGGTDVRIDAIDRDHDQELALLDACSSWWERHIEGDEPPEPVTAEERWRLLDERFPRVLDAKLVRRDETFEAAEAMRWLTLAKRMNKTLEPAIKHLEAMLCERIGAGYGLETEAGRIVWFEREGNVDWKALALSLGATEQRAEEHRGAPFRVPRFTEAKAPKALKTRNRR